MSALSNKARGNIYMTVAKTFSGLNENALRYLLPTYMNAYSGVLMRLGVGSLLFWILGWVKRTAEKVTWRDRLLLLLTGLIVVFGYMWTLLEGLTYTTPITSSIFISLEPVFTFIICLMLRTEKISIYKVIGILLGVGGALLIVMTQHTSDVASNPMLGAMYCLLSAVMFSTYLVVEKKFLKRLSNATVSKWSFLGGAIGAAIVVAITGWDASVLTKGIFSIPMLVLMFVLIFPTFISYLLTDMALKVLPTTVVALYGDLILVVAAIASYILGQDHFSIWQPIAILLMGASVYFVENAESRPTSPNSTASPGSSVSTTSTNSVPASPTAEHAASPSTSAR